MIIGVAVKAGQLMIALPKPNRHADCIRMIEQLGLESRYETEWGKSLHQGFYDQQGVFYTRPQAHAHAIACGQITWSQSQLEHIAENPEYPSLCGICSEDLW